MTIKINFQGKSYIADLNAPIDISIPLREGAENPNCYFADPVKLETIRSGDFIGSVKEGGRVNYQKMTFTTHGNGTHTECYGHITASGATVNKSLKQFHFMAEVISVTPQETENGDLVVGADQILKKRKFPNTKAVIIRSLPNGVDKKQKQYSGNNPPYFEHKALEALAERDVEHFLTDLPSIDKESDEGMLLSHKAFWKSTSQKVRKSCTITELIYVSEKIKDGLYLLNLQIPSFEMDSAPSKPVLYTLEVEN